VFCNSTCNLVFKLQWPFATHCIFTPMNVIRQVAWIARNATHHTCDHTWMQLIAKLLQLCCNNYFQLFYNSPMTTTTISCSCHFSSINQILTHGTMRWWMFLWNINIHHPLWLFILYGLTLWHVAKSRVATWHINWILETNIYKYLGRSIHSHKYYIINYQNNCFDN